MGEHLEQTNLVIRLREGAHNRCYWDAQWRYRTGPLEPWRLKKRRLGLAWQERDEAGKWRKRRGRCPEGWLDERAAHLAAVAAMETQMGQVAAEREAAAKAAEAALTVRVLAHDWHSWLKEVWGAKPSTIKDYSFLLREPGEPFKRGLGRTAGRIMKAFGDRPAAEVTTKDVGDFLRSLDREGLAPRNVNKHREVLAAIFAYGCRKDTFALSTNPVDRTDKRRQPPPAALDYYEVDEVERLASCCEQGRHRQPRTILDEAELAARRLEDQQDADACRLLFYTGLRLGEVLALLWEDVDFDRRVLFVRRALSAGVEGLPKGGRPRIVPMSTPAMVALRRLACRTHFVSPADYVLVNRFGRRLDPSALRRRYKRGCTAAGLRPVRLHGLRHAAGSLVARTSDAVFVRDFLGHSKLSTTDRYVSAKARPEELERLDRAFASTTSRGED
jgi:integrase